MIEDEIEPREETVPLYKLVKGKNYEKVLARKQKRDKFRIMLTGESKQPRPAIC